MSEQAASRHYLRNLIALTGDTVAFSVAFACSDPSTVMPAFARHLTSSAPLIGLLSTINAGGWLLPQLIAANYVANKERKKPYIVKPLIVGRFMFLILAGITFFYGVRKPLLTLLALYFCQAVFWICDGLASVPWFDVLAKVFPGRRRGRFLAISQVSGGLFAVGASEAVRRVLDPHTGLAFPNNFALLFLAAFLFLLTSFGFLALLKEPVEDAHAERKSWRQFLPMLARTLRQDSPFRLAVCARVLAGLGSMATPFFVLYGTEALELGSALIGLCLAAQVIGRIMGGLLLGFSVEKLGNRATIFVGVTVTACAPALALLFGHLASNFGQTTWLFYAFPLVFLLLGMSLNVLGWSFTNYVLDIAPARDRATYVGLMNTLVGTVVLAPVIGGALLDATSYAVLFGTALAIYVITLALAVRLPKAARQVQPADPTS